MRKVKEVLRLRFELRFGQRQIARSCRMGLSTVHEYLERAEAAGVGWPLPEDWSEEELEAKLFGQQPVSPRAEKQRPQPDWKTIHEQLQQHRHLSLQLVWEEYRQAHPEGVSLQLVLRALSALAATPGCSAAPGTQSRREDVRGLGGSNDSRL